MRAADAVPESDRADAAPHPRETASLFGQARAERELLDAYRGGRLHHAWLIGGAAGIGKATLAWRFARFLVAHPDPDSVRVQDASDLSVPRDHAAARRVASGAPGDVAVLRRAWNDKSGRFFSDIRVDEVRRMAGLFQQASRAGGYRICIIDTVEDLNLNSVNALLKLIEEPPSRSLFLLLAHHPARALPTLRSRCRKLNLDPLGTEDAVAALLALGPPWSTTDRAVLEEAVRRAGGSVSGALPLLGGERLVLSREATGLLARLPQIDWDGLHRLAEKVGSDEDDFAVLTGAILDWLHGRLEAGGAGTGESRRLAPLAEVWEKVRRSSRDTLALNLDRKAFLFSAFADLAQAMRAL